MAGRSKKIRGTCHCGNIAYSLGWPADANGIGARACGCTFCRKHGARWTSHPRATLEISIADDDDVSRYRFGTGTAEFLVCRRCGVPPVVVSTIEGQTYAVVNVNTFAEGHGLEVTDSTTDFEAEDAASRLDRRQRHWIAAVSNLQAGR